MGLDGFSIGEMPQSHPAFDCPRCTMLRRVLIPEVRRSLGEYFKFEVYHGEVTFDTCSMLLELHKEIPEALLRKAASLSTGQEKRKLYDMMEQYGLTREQAMSAVVE